MPLRRGYQERYDNLPAHKKKCARAHKSTGGLCVCCLTRPSTQIHHTLYGCDRLGQTIFPVCAECHRQSHSAKNWIKHPSNPVWKNHNTPEWKRKLKRGFKIAVAVAKNLKINKSSKKPK